MEGNDDRVKSADRALAILALVADRKSIRFQEITSELGLARSSAHGLLRTLIARGWIYHDEEGRAYRLGLRAWQVGQQYAGHREIADLSRGPMDELALRLDETVQLARLDGIENVYIAISESSRPIRLASSVGMRLHAHATALGKVLLSQLPEQEVERRLTSVVLPSFTEDTITVLAAILAELGTVRRLGYAVDKGEYLAGTQCVAVPLMSDSDGLSAALSVTAPSNRCTADWPTAVLDELRATAAVIRRGVGLDTTESGG